MRSMSFERWQTLSPHAQRICRYVVCDRGETVIGEGYRIPTAGSAGAVPQDAVWAGPGTDG